MHNLQVIPSHYVMWEDYRNGLYQRRCDPAQIEEAVAVLERPDRFAAVLAEVAEEWPGSEISERPPNSVSRAWRRKGGRCRGMPRSDTSKSPPAMPELPVVSGEECIRALETIGYHRARQRGSHVRMRCAGRPPVTVPLHRELDRGTLRAILRDANISVTEFTAALR
ncbi:MAG: type II toxin-antitoxin system HicA family toxin [Rhodothermales bacterium]|nr:type II toxin-antitoxin system HicA family toxin [Rhodothermales bacterium]